MYGLKDKFSRLLVGDSSSPTTTTSSPASQPDPDPDPDPDPPQARRYSKVGKSLYSLVSYVLPSTASQNSQSQEDNQSYIILPHSPGNTHHHDDEQYPKIEECASKCRSDLIEKVKKDGITLQYEGKLGKGCSPQNETPRDLFFSPRDDPSDRKSSDSDVFEEAIDHETPRKPLPNLADDSVFVSSDLYEFLESSLPNIVKGCQWVLLYSTQKDGISLRTLIRKSSDLPGPCLLIVGDVKGAVFGGMIECPLVPTPKRKYQGTNQTFVFTTIYGAPRLFRPTGANRFYHMCTNDLLGLGGGGDFALRLNEDLLSGSSGACDTFGNLCLAHSSEFELKNVELWGFTHISRYLR
ncbi:hypothetical protein ACFE04_008890 [Oxalis oulophora]